MTLQERITELHDEIVRLAEQRGARNVRVFGSVARGQETPQSDLDILVDLDGHRSLMDLGGLQVDLEELLGCSVDVVTEDGLRPSIRQEVLQQAVAL
jgi:hypothetical protein